MWVLPHSSHLPTHPPTLPPLVCLKFGTFSVFLFSYLLLLLNLHEFFSQKYVAIKYMKAAAQEKMMEEILKEASTMQTLQHPYILVFYGISLPFEKQPLRLVSTRTMRGWCGVCLSCLVCPQVTCSSGLKMNFKENITAKSYFSCLWLFFGFWVVFEPFCGFFNPLPLPTLTK